MHFLKKSLFTLIEILIVMMILTLVLSVTGVKVHNIYKEQKFLSETQQVLSKLRTAQDLMVLMDTDVKVHLTKNMAKNEVICQLDVQKPLDRIWAKLVEKPLILHSIRGWTFEGNSSPLTLQFINGAMSQGLLVLKDDAHSSKDEGRSININLLGYPAPIKITKETKGLEEQTRRNHFLYPEYVYEKFYKKQTDK